jgi:hypothetical protein
LSAFSKVCIELAWCSEIAWCFELYGRITLADGKDLKLSPVEGSQYAGISYPVREITKAKHLLSHALLNIFVPELAVD